MSKGQTDKWDTGECHKVAEDCDWAENYTGSIIYIMPDVWAVIRRLCKDVKTEWQMLLCGTIADNGVLVSGYWIPKQEVSSSTVTNLDIVDSKVIEEKRIIATVHSHSDMGTFFSSTDTQFTNLSLIKYHIVVNNKGSTKATTRHTLPCGLDKFFECTVELYYPDVEVVGKDNITEKTYSYPAGMCGQGIDWHEKEWDTDKRRMRGKKKHAIFDEEQAMLFKGGVK